MSRFGSLVVGTIVLPTSFTYTGQREAAEIGLHYYIARWYDAGIGHFLQADTIVPGAGNPMAWNRYGYVKYNPLIYTDPNGHKCVPISDGSLKCDHNYLENNASNNFENDIFVGLTHVATFLFDTGELVVSFAGYMTELALSTMTLVDPLPGNEVVGPIVGIEIYATTFGKVENALGTLGFLNELTQGFYVGDNSFNKSTGELFLGKDTTTEIIFAVLGNTFNEAGLDLVLNIASTGYDIVSATNYWNGPFSIKIDSCGFSLINNGKTIFMIPTKLDFLEDLN